jgi:protein involved in polysaccharide export with SLBB domain
MRRLVLFLTMTGACCAQLFDQAPTSQRSRNGLFSPPSQQQQRALYLCSLPENANSAACLSSQGPEDSFGSQGILPQQNPYLGLDRGADYDLSETQTQAFPAPAMSGNRSSNQSSQAARPYQVGEPPTEFQRYVAESIGQNLQIFGASLFNRVPGTFMPSNRALVGPDYVIGPDDELQINVWGQLNLVRRLVVDPRGEIVLPDVGPIVVAGLRYGQVGAVLKTAMQKAYKNFELSVTLGRARSIQIFVVGDARRPGNYTLSSLTTLVNAVFASGGPSSHGSMRNIRLQRGDKEVCEFDLYDLLMHGDTSKDAQLQGGDVILIPPAGPRVAIAGSVERPGIYELSDGTTLADALRMAGGLSAIAAVQDAVVERVADGAGLEIRRISTAGAGLKSKLQNGDIVRLLPIVRRFENAVTLRGNVADPGRFPWRAGMRISDVIPNKEYLLTRDYWKERNNLGTRVTDEPAPSAEASPVESGAPQLVPAMAVTKTAAPAVSQPPSYRENQRNTQGDTSLGAATGLDDAPPVRDFVPRNTIQPAAPEINWEYAVVERTDKETLASRIIPFNLGSAVVKRDPTQDLALEPGDTITIFSKADFSLPRTQQAKQVRLEGEVAMAGVYTALPGETLRELVARAGGLTPNAYLYGAQFTRESTRREQQKRFNDFLSQLERETNESAANLSGRVTSTEQAATTQATLASQRELIGRLKEIPVNGRIVLDLDPKSQGIAALPALALENGDRLYIPNRPSTVNVIGTVFQQAAFLYGDDLRAGDYLKKAGGPSRFADKSHMVVVRADGSVVSHGTGSVLFSKNFDAVPMFPGDTLVVPSYINKTTFLRGLMDWSQLFGNLALGAAAINVLH